MNYELCTPQEQGAADCHDIAFPHMACAHVTRYSVRDRARTEERLQPHVPSLQPCVPGGLPASMEGQTQRRVEVRRRRRHSPAARTISPQLEPSPRSSNTLHLTPYTLHLTPYTSHLTPHTLHLTPYTLHLTPHTVHRTPYTSHLTPYTLHLTGIFLQLEAPNGLRQMYFTVLQTKDGKLSGVGDTALLDISEFELFPRLFK